MAMTAMALSFFSGAAGLLYEILWAKNLAFVLGSTAWAQSVVLAGFLGGLCIGSLKLGKRADAAPCAWRFYACLQWGIAAVGGAAPWILRALDHDGTRWLCVPAVAAAAFLMGGTVPALCRAVGNCGTSDAAGGAVQATVGRLYGANSAGAVLGCLAAAFWLIPAFGLDVSWRLAAALNAVAGLAAWLSSGGTSLPAVVAPRRRAGEETYPAGLVFGAVFLSGFVAITYEVAWTRLLALVMGSSVYSFAEMLGAFIAGVSLGGFLAGAGPLRRRDPARLLGWSLAAAGVSTLAGLPLCGRLPYYFFRLCAHFSASTAGFYACEAAKFGLCAALMLAPAVCFGLSLPAAVRLREPENGEVGAGVGAVFAANGLGNVLGAAAGMALLPWLGVEGLLRSGTTVLLAAGAAVLWQSWGTGRNEVHSAGSCGTSAAAGAGRRRWGWAMAGLAAVLAVRAMVPRWDLRMLAAGGYRGHGEEPGGIGSFSAYRELFQNVKLLFYRDGREATVSVLAFANGDLSLKVNGKTDASSGHDMRTQVLLGELPMLLKPGAKSALVVGWGSGITVGSVLRHPVELVDAVELSPAVVGASRFFQGANGDAMQDQRVRLHVEDAKTFLRRVPQRYDVIISEPSNPWMEGVASLFSADFYRDARRRLEPGGLMAQWFHLYEMDDELFALTLRTFCSQFAHVALWSIAGADVILVGSQESLEPDYRAMERAWSAPAVRADARRADIGCLTTLLGLQSAGEASVGAMAGQGALNTIDRPLLEYGAPRAFFRRDWVRLVRLNDDRRSASGAQDLLLTRYLAARGRPLQRDEFYDRAVFPDSIDAMAALAAVIAQWRRRYPRDPAAAVAARWLQDHQKAIGL